MTDILWMKNFNTTVWYFPGDVPSKDEIHGTSDYQGRFPPSIPKILIDKYTKKGDLVIDPFVGGGTTLVEAKKLLRNCLGFDINKKAVELSNLKLEKIKTQGIICKAIIGDATNLFLKDNSVDLVITSPPYWNLIKYSNEKNCLANQTSFDEYLMGLEKSISEMYRVLKPKKYCCVIIGDAIEGWKYHPLGYLSQNFFEKVGFILQRVVIHIQARTNSFLYGNSLVKEKVLERGFFLIAHEYIIIGKK